MECFTGSGGRSRLGASRRPFGDGSCYRHSQPSPHNPYGVLAFDEFTDEAKSLRCLSYLTNRDLHTQEISSIKYAKTAWLSG